MNIDLRQVVLAIETAVSLVGMNDTNHGKRVGYIAGQLAHQMGWSEAELQDVFELGMLHDCGVSTEKTHAQLVNHFDWNDAHIHCEIGYRLLKDFPPFAKYAVPVLHHHTHWQDLVDSDVDARDAKLANLIFLADRIDVLSSAHYGKDILLVRAHILQSIQQYAGTYFNPDLVHVFATLSRLEAFWISLEDRHIIRYTWDMGRYERSEHLGLSGVRHVSLILAYIVDQKSPFTAQHSARVATLAYYLAQTSGFTDERCEQIEIAALLHDLGKLHTPDRILEKPDRLNDVERAIMHQHSYETYEILRQITGLGEIAVWAAYHHEGLNGSGYPFHSTAKDLSQESRLIAVADVFQALVQDRPYRQGMELSDVLAVLDQDVASGRLDGAIVAHVKQRQDDCFSIARGEHVMNARNEILSFQGER